MKCLERNKTPFYYCLFNGTEKVLDENGKRTGAERVVYSPPRKMKANISTAKGEAQIQQFGNDIRYDKVVVVDDINCPIDENTVLFIDKEPSFDEFGNPLFDYIVKKAAKSLNSISYAISKVEVS